MRIVALVLLGLLVGCVSWVGAGEMTDIAHPKTHVEQPLLTGPFGEESTGAHRAEKRPGRAMGARKEPWGGFILHAPPGVAYSTDASAEELCGLGAIGSGFDQVNSIPASNEKEWVWYIISEFLELGSFAEVEYGIVYDPALYVGAAGLICAPGPVITEEYPHAGAWPQAGSGIRIMLADESEWSGHTVTTGLIHGWHYTYMEPTTITLGPNPATGFMGWRSSAGHEDWPLSIAVLGVDRPGAPCIIMGSDDFGACCLPDGTCSIRAWEACEWLGGEFMDGEWECTPDLCPPLAQGETIDSAIDMVTLPFRGEGLLDAYFNNHEFGYGKSPDIVYAFTPEQDGCIEVDGKESQYDQMIFVLDEMLGIVAWNDDGVGYEVGQSRITWMPVEAGVRYYFVVDGYYGAAGPYEIDVSWRDCPPAPDCPPGALAEGEECADPHEDLFNGGCNSTPSAFSEVACSSEAIVICGTLFDYVDQEGVARRDMDWYLLEDLAEIGAVEVTATGYFETSGDLAIVQIVEPCTAAASTMISVPTRQEGSVQRRCDPADGEWAVVVAKHYCDTGWYECEEPGAREMSAAGSWQSGFGWPYLVTIEGYLCEEVVPGRAETWGRVKSLYR